MISSAGLLDFFILEAGDYVERLDALVATAGPAGPDADAFSRHARALRGSATMAKLGGMSELAGAVERVGRGLREGALGWGPHLQGALVAAIDDLKILVRAVRTWGSAEDRRVQARVSELNAFTAAVRPAAHTPAVGVGFGWLAGEAAGIADALERVAAHPAEEGAAGGALAQALGRVRAMRGVATVKDHPALAHLLEGIERAGKPVELGGAAAHAEALAVLSAGVDALRRVAREVGGGGAAGPDAPELERFELALEAFAGAREDIDRVVPVGVLFFADEGPHVVRRAPAPPTTPAQRFRLEVVSQAEHLRALVAEGRTARGAGDRERVGRALGGALRALRELAESFEERAVAQFVEASGDGAARLDALTLGALDEVAAMLADPRQTGDAVARRAEELLRGRAVDRAVGAALSDRAVRAPSGVTTTEPRLSSTLGAHATPALPVAAVPTAAPPVAQALAADLPLPSIDEFLYEGEAAAADAAVEVSVPPAVEPAPAPARYPTPTGRALHDLLENGITEIQRLEQSPLSEPVPVVDDSLVDVDALVYSGRSALARARELVHALRDGGEPASPDVIDELLDLLELAT